MLGLEAIREIYHFKLRQKSELITETKQILQVNSKEVAFEDFDPHGKI